MKQKFNKSLALILLCLFGCVSMYAQGVAVTGTVTDRSGAPLPGAVVFAKGTTATAMTSSDGRYSVRVNNLNATLVFSMVSFQTLEVPLNGRASLDVVLAENQELLDEVVVVAYGTQKRASITGAISSVSNRELIKAPTMSLSNVVGARVAGVAAVQSSGQPGSDAANLTIRGQGVIYIVDGIRRSSADFNGLDPNEVESVAILKNASAVAVYGLDASSALIVTTKQGSRNKMSITYSASAGISQNAHQQTWLDGPGYAYWYNKARNLDGDTEIFTQEMVQKMRTGTDGWGNTNWYDKIFGTGSRQHHNISASGGNDKVNFFSSLGYLQEKGNIQHFNYDRLNLRTNVNAKLTDALTFAVGIAGRVETRNAPRYSANPNDWHNIPQQAIRALPYVPETVERDGKVYNVSTPTASSPVSPMGALNESGYSRSNYAYIQSNFSLQYDAPWLKGLSAKFQGAYDLVYTFSKSLTTPYQLMAMSLPNASTTSLSYYLANDASGNSVSLTESAGRSYNFTTQTSLSYNNSCGKHNVSILALAETRENKSNSLGATGYGLDFIMLDELNKITNKTGNGEERIPSISGYSGHTRVAGFVGRVNYDYNNTYLLEASVRHDGSYLFGGMNTRWVTLPGLSLGWRMSNEDWFDMDWVNSLKIRGGIGKTAASGVSAFQWRNTMASSSNSLVLGDQSQSMIYASVLGNPNLTWEQSVDYNFGFDATLLNNRLGVEFDVFYKHRYDILTTISGSYPPSMGGYYFNYVNANEADYKGFDMTLTHQNTLGDFSYGVKLIWSYTYGRWLKYASDAENTPDYAKLTGKQIGAKRGFIAQGLFQTTQDIANAATISGSPVLPGYIKYLDRNGDGVISYAQDMGYVGKSSTPTHAGSLNLFGSWKGFSLDMLFSWGLGHTVALTGVYTSSGSEGVMDNTAFTKPFYHGGNAPQFMVENSWTPENTSTEFPRLSLVTVSSNNAYSSTFWYRDGDYLRLKTAQLAYDFPKKWLQTVNIDGFRIFVEGYNLFTFSELTKYNIDPESPAVNNGYYPQQRTFSVGVKLTF